MPCFRVQYGAGHIICDMFLAYSFAVSQILVTFAATKGSRRSMPALHYPVWLLLRGAATFVKKAARHSHPQHSSPSHGARHGVTIIHLTTVIWKCSLPLSSISSNVYIMAIFLRVNTIQRNVDCTIRYTS